MIIPIYKEKGDIQDCGHYRGIKLMSHTMKIWERIIDRRLRGETIIGDEQFGFMPCRGTTDAIHALVYCCLMRLIYLVILLLTLVNDGTHRHG